MNAGATYTRLLLRLLYAAAVAVILPGSAGAKLSSTKAQESAMIARIVPVTEKWLRRVNDRFDKNEPFSADIAAMSRDICPLENGIFNDIYVCADASRLLVCAGKKDARLYRFIDALDAGANQLCASDRARFYGAKARVFAEKLACPDSLKQDWFARITACCSAAARNGFDADRGISLLRKFAEKNDLSAQVEEAFCTIYREYAGFFLAKAKSFHKSKGAIETALQAIREIPPASLADAASCGRQLSDAEHCIAYDRILVQPLAAVVGKNRSSFLIEVCKRYWQQKKLVSLALPRLTIPSNDAFDLFKRAGADDQLKADPRIAAAELLLWKKAGKLQDFRKNYPDRYRLGRSAQGL
jgi:hypothetical protein